MGVVDVFSAPQIYFAHYFEKNSMVWLGLPEARAIDGLYANTNLQIEAR
jgi:hypothetical protein